MAAHIIRFKDPFRATTEFRFQELESFIQITQRACEEVARREKEILEETISAILKESPAICDRKFESGEGILLRSAKAEKV
jgi:hypothetical protein